MKAIVFLYISNTNIHVSNEFFFIYDETSMSPIKIFISLIKSFYFHTTPPYLIFLYCFYDHKTFSTLEGTSKLIEL
jgi:hypothetical protein